MIGVGNMKQCEGQEKKKNATREKEYECLIQVKQLDVIWASPKQLRVGIENKYVKEKQVFFLEGSDRRRSTSWQTDIMGSSSAQTAESEPWEPDVLSCQAAQMGETEGSMGRQLWARRFLVQMLDKSIY